MCVVSNQENMFTRKPPFIVKLRQLYALDITKKVTLNQFSNKWHPSNNSAGQKELSKP